MKTFKSRRLESRKKKRGGHDPDRRRRKEEGGHHFVCMPTIRALGKRDKDAKGARGVY